MAHNQRSIKEGGRGLVMVSSKPGILRHSISNAIYIWRINTSSLNLQGVVEGVGGVISKPISGAKEEGVLGFAKGAGKGVIGLFTRPVSGVADFASGTLETVRRYVSLNLEG